MIDSKARLDDVTRSGVSGELGEEETNVKGNWMMEKCLRHKLAMCDTFYRKRDLHEKTWIRRVRVETVGS